VDHPGQILHWLGCGAPAGVLLGRLLACAAILLVLRWNRGDRSLPTGSWLPVLVLMAAHLVAVAFSSWTSYPGPDINTRMLGPVFVGSIILGATLIGYAWAKGSRPVRGAAVLAAVALLGFKAYAARDVVARLLLDGQGYTSTAWTRSSTVAALQRLQPTVIYANDIGAVYYFMGGSPTASRYATIRSRNGNVPSTRRSTVGCGVACEKVRGCWFSSARRRFQRRPGRRKSRAASSPSTLGRTERSMPMAGAPCRNATGSPIRRRSRRRPVKEERPASRLWLSRRERGEHTYHDSATRWQRGQVILRDPGRAEGVSAVSAVRLES
jgi:hypothetical protein